MTSTTRLWQRVIRLATIHSIISVPSSTASSPYVLNTNKANDIIHAHLFRPPHGWMRPCEYWWLHRTYKVIMWDVVTRDYSKWMTAEDVVNNVKRYARNGSIITFHDSLKSIEKLKTALPQAIEWLMEQGYEFKTFE